MTEEITLQQLRDFAKTLGDEVINVSNSGT